MSKQLPPPDADLAATREYFALRADRYALCLRSYPFARILDLLPYCYLLRDTAARIGKDISELRVLDAFGGTGFLSYAFRHSGMHFTVADCCPAMLELGRNHAKNVRWRETTNYFTRMAETEPESYDVVLCHGGLHHVFAETDGKVDHVLARQRQRITVTNLAHLLVRHGTCIIGDIPDIPPQKRFVGIDSQSLPHEILRKLLGRDQYEMVGHYGLKTAAFSLAHLTEVVRHRFSKVIDFPVPRHFFDHFVSLETPLGHKASFVPVDVLDGMARDARLDLRVRLDFRGPWLFPNRRAAAWFFREKFAYAESASIGDAPETEEFVAQRIAEQLGSREIEGDLFAVNWGVVYSCFVKT